MIRPRLRPDIWTYISENLVLPEHRTVEGAPTNDVAVQNYLLKRGQYGATTTSRMIQRQPQVSRAPHIDTNDNCISNKTKAALERQPDPDTSNSTSHPATITFTPVAMGAVHSSAHVQKKQQQQLPTQLVHSHNIPTREESDTSHSEEAFTDQSTDESSNNTSDNDSSHTGGSTPPPPLLSTSIYQPNGTTLTDTDTDSTDEPTELGCTASTTWQIQHVTDMDDDSDRGSTTSSTSNGDCQPHHHTNID